MSETPTQTVVNATMTPTEIPSPVGKIVVRVLTPVEQFRLKKFVGKFMDNLGYLGDAMVAASVRQIGELPMPFPQNEAGVEFILEKLGFEGWDAVKAHFEKLGAERMAEIEFAKN